MVRQVQYLLIDDVDGSPAVETIHFARGDHHYEIDLNEEHARQFNECLDYWSGHARKVESPHGPKTRGARKSAKPSDAAKIREWATAHGIQVGPRGRIPSDIREKYYAANPDETPRD